jgi:O-antigen/teichoic acid export membrane protein
MKSNLMKRFLSFSYGGAAGAAIGFLTTILTTRILSPEEFGKTSMFTLFISLATLLTIFGTDQAFVRFFYEEEEKKRGSLLYNCLKVAGLILLPVTISIFIFKESLLIFLFDEYDLSMFFVVLLAIISQLLYRFATLVIRMQQKGNLFSIFEILNRFFVLAGVILFYNFFGSNYRIVIFSTVLSFVLLLIVLILIQKEYWSLKNFAAKDVTHSKKNIYSYSYPLVFTAVIMWIFEGVDKFMIRHWADLNELGLYSAAFKIIGLLTVMQMVFTTFWSPVAYETYQKTPLNTIFYSRVSKYVSVAMLMVAIIVIMLKDLIIMLLGDEYEGASRMLSFLVFIPLMYTISETTVIGINFHKKVKWHILIAAIACVVNAIGNLWLVPSFGGIGASISTGVSYIIFLILRTTISLRYYKVDYGLKKLYISVAIVFLYAVYTLLSNKIIQDEFVGILCIAIIFSVYFRELKDLLSLRIGKGV